MFDMSIDQKDKSTSQLLALAIGTDETVMMCDVELSPLPSQVDVPPIEVIYLPSGFLFFSTEKQQSQLLGVIYQYTPIFTERPGLCTCTKFTIETENHKTIRCHPRPMTPGKRIEETVDESLADEVIEPS